LEDEISSSSEGTGVDDFDINTFINYTGCLEDVDEEDKYLPPIGFEKLPARTIQSLKFYASNTCAMDANHYQLLVKYYQCYFEDSSLVSINQDTFGTNNVVVSDRISKFRSINILGHKYNSSETVSRRGSLIRAYYIINDDVNDNILRSAQILYCLSVG
jgi:hypothetical protein